MTGNQRKYLKLLLLLGFLVIGPLVTIDVVYLATMRSIKDRPLPSPAKPPPRLMTAAIWSAFGERVPVEVKPISSLDIMLSLVRGEPLGDKRGGHLTSYLSQRYLSNEASIDKSLVWQLKTAS